MVCVYFTTLCSLVLTVIMKYDVGILITTKKQQQLSYDYIILLKRWLYVNRNIIFFCITYYWSDCYLGSVSDALWVKSGEYLLEIARKVIKSLSKVWRKETVLGVILWCCFFPHCPREWCTIVISKISFKHWISIMKTCSICFSYKAYMRPCI